MSGFGASAAFCILNTILAAERNSTLGSLRELSFDEVEVTLARWETDVTRLAELFVDSPAQLGVIGWLRGRLATLADFKPLLAHVCQPGMKERHWEAVSLHQNSRLPRLTSFSAE